MSAIEHNTVMSSIYLRRVGAIKADIMVVSNITSAAEIADNLKGQTHLVTGAITITLPLAVVGMNASFRVITAHQFSLKSNALDQFILNKTLLTAGNKITSSGSIYDTVYLECTQQYKWDVYISDGMFTDTGA